MSMLFDFQWKGKWLICSNNKNFNQLNFPSGPDIFHNTQTYMNIKTDTIQIFNKYIFIQDPTGSNIS